MAQPRLPSEAAALTRRLLKRVAGMSFEEQRALLEMLETRTDVEKRELPRRSSALVVTYTDACRRYEDLARDISAGGLFIETRERFVVGDQIGIAFRLPDVSAPIRLSGKIVRTSPTGIGVQFDWKIPPE
ncbi:MAG: PilZ domain-containing protein [Desulfobacterales bacterium]|jgi:Tfp pilus assembly protein PilZ|nr:PilZ domain-containing protein [Desulfobacterales bacterium]